MIGRQLLFVALTLSLFVSNAPAQRPFVGSDRWIVDNVGRFQRLSSAGKHYFTRKYQLQNNPVYMGGAQSALSISGRRSLPSAHNSLVNNPSNNLTQNETCVALSTNGTIVVSFNDATVSSNTSGYAWSTNGGAGYNYSGRASIPDYTGGIDGSLNNGDGVVAAGPGNVVYYATLADDMSGNHTIALSKSTNGGVTFGVPVNVTAGFANTTDFQDKDWLAVDRANGNVYVAWTDFTASNGDAIYFARSTNGGASFSAPQPLSPVDGSTVVQGSSIAVGPQGQVYVAWEDGHDTEHIAVRKSTSGGVSFGPTVTAATFTPVGTPLGGFDVNNFPSMGVSISDGTVYIVFNYRPAGRDRSDIGLVKSTDGGNTFTPPTRVNTDSTTRDQFMPAVAVNSTGQPGIQWYDRRNSRTNTAIDVYASINGANVRVTDVSWPLARVQPGLRSYYHGDYNQLLSDGVDFLMAWGDERSGNPDVGFRILP